MTASSSAVDAKDALRHANPGPDTNFRTTMRIGLALFAVLAVVVFGWLAISPLASAVIAPGTAMVRGRPQLVQHLDGGIVHNIAVRNGDVVRRGDLLVQLDDTLLLANLEIYRNRLREANVRKARLESERDGLSEIAFDDRLVAQLALGEDWLQKEGQRKLFSARRISRAGQVEQLREKIAQAGNQIAGVEGLVAARREQLGSIDQELKGLRELLEKGIASTTRVLTQERSRAELMGQIAEHNAELARIRNTIRETEISILQVHRQFQESVLTELRDATTQVEDMAQQITATTKQLERVEIRAPSQGMVHELAINTIGGVIPPGATLMQLVPLDEGVEIEVNVETQAIDQLRIGQEAVVRFPAFNQATTPHVFGKVARISPTSVVDEKTGMAFYRIGIDLEQAEIARLGSVRLLPGMPAEAHLTLEARTALSYLLKPLNDHLWRAMRER
jgi:HlyD family secretion protein